MAFLLTGYIMDARYGFSKLLDEKAYSQSCELDLDLHASCCRPLLVIFQ